MIKYSHRAGHLLPGSVFFSWMHGTAVYLGAEKPQDPVCSTEARRDNAGCIIVFSVVVLFSGSGGNI